LHRVAFGCGGGEGLRPSFDDQRSMRGWLGWGIWGAVLFVFRGMWGNVGL
jgi:hypothetical protein